MAVLDHYQIQALHLHPNFVLTLAIFAFLCEGFLGVVPSVAFFRTFFSLRLMAPDQRSGCVSFRVADGMAESLIHMKGPKKREDFRKKWVYLDAGEVNPLLEVPTAPAVKAAEEWAHLKGVTGDIRPLKKAMAHLRKAGLTGQLVVKEFLERRIAPLQDHPKRV